MKPGKDWREEIAPDEETRFTRHAEALRAVQEKNAKGGALPRALHAKGNIGLKAELTILPDVPEVARVGIFSQPGTLRAYVRFSNGAGAVQHDAKGDVRGVALKVMGVPGKKLIPGLEDAKTQDFLLIQTPAVPFQNADEFVGLVSAITFPQKLPGFVFRIGLRRFLSLAKTMSAGLSRPVTSLATSQYWSALPIKFGEYAARYTLRPKALYQAAPDKKSPNYLREELSGRLRQGAIQYELAFQFYTDAQKTPIENASVDWKESDAPYVTLATLTLPQQDVDSSEGKAVSEYLEKVSFDPWHAPEEFRPLGSMMRARKYAYKASVLARGTTPEPDGSESFIRLS